MSAALFDVSRRGKLEAFGRDAAEFLHNLSTTDVKGLSAGEGREAFFCTATARAVGHGWVWRHANEGRRQRLWLDLDPGLNEKLLAHLRKYLISEDVELTDHTDRLRQFHVVGPGATEVLAAAGVDPGSWRQLTFAEVGGVVVRHTDSLGEPGFDLLGPPEWRDRLVAAGARLSGDDDYEVRRIEAGTPAFGIDIDETTFAPEAGRTAQAISYAKGCYLGQEPIVMARDRGVVQRGLVGLRLGDEVVPGGSLLFRDGKEVGRVTSSVRSPRLGGIALGYARRGAQAPGTEVEVDAGGQRIPARVVALPFDV